MKNKLIEVDNCIFDESQLKHSHGYDELDEIGKEAFVNHIHIDETNREMKASSIINTWISEMRRKWPNKTFRIYRQIEEDEITIRFHKVRTGQPNWCESGVEIIEINT